jgi:chromosome segregation ATPase
MANIFSFLSTFGSQKLSQVGENITQKIVAWDPETASEAEIEEMIHELDKITAEAGKAMAEYEKEKAEADAIKRNYDKYMSAAEILNKQVEEAKASGNEGKAQELGTSLDKLLKDLEQMHPEVDREAKEAAEAKAYADEVRALAETTAEKLRTARSQLERAKRDMRRAEIEQQRAQERAEKSEHLAGLRKDTSSLGVALAAMNKQAEEAKASASASDLKTKLLTPPEEKADDNVKAALDAVSGQEPTAKASFADRLAALRDKQ